MGPNTEVEVTGTDGAAYSAQLCSLPMYDAEGAIVRGKYDNSRWPPALEREVPKVIEVFFLLG